MTEQTNAIHISDHALLRYRERIRSLADDDMLARADLQHCILAAKPKHVSARTLNKRTAMIPTGCCMFVCSFGTVVTILETPYPGMKKGTLGEQLPKQEE